MTFETITLGALRTQVSRKIANLDTLPTELTTEVTFALECAYRDLCAISHSSRLLATPGTGITLVTGTTTYGLEDDLFKVIAGTMRITTAPFWTLGEMTRQQFDQYLMAAFNRTGYPTHWIMVGASASTGKEQVFVWPTPSAAANGKVISYYYVPTLASLLSGNDSTTLDKRLPPEWHHYLVAGALQHLPAYISAQELAHFSGLWQRYLIQARRDASAMVGESYQHQRNDRHDIQAGRVMVNYPLSP